MTDDNFFEIDKKNSIIIIYIIIYIIINSAHA